LKSTSMASWRWRSVTRGFIRARGGLRRGSALGWRRKLGLRMWLARFPLMRSLPLF